MIVLRVRTLIEIVLRSQLAESGEKLEGMYEGQKNRKEGKPTAKRLLRAIARLELTLTLVKLAGQLSWYLPPLPPLLLRVLDLLGLAPSLYTDLTRPSPSPSPVPSG